MLGIEPRFICLLAGRIGVGDTLLLFAKEGKVPEDLNSLLISPPSFLFYIGGGLFLLKSSRAA
jgi:hypothetical protein